MDSGHCLDVVVGRPSSPRQLPEGPCLLIEAESFDREAWLSQTDLQARRSPLLFEHCALGHVDGQSVTWNKFSDQRFDGPWPLSEFISTYPNLRSITSEEIPGASLASILKRHACFFASDSSFSLTIRQGDPCQILCGAGQWLERCSSISLRGSSLSVHILSRVEQELKAAHFYQSRDDSTLWLPEIKTISNKRWSTLLEGLRSLFDVNAYRLIHPELSDYSESALLDHWLAEPDLPRLRKVMGQLACQEPRRIDEMGDNETAIQCILSIFPFQYYRSLRPDLAVLTNRELLNHFWNLGRSEGVDLSESAVQSGLLHKAESELQLVRDKAESELQLVRDKAESELQVARAHIKQLEQLLASSLAQIDAFRQLVADVPTAGGLNE